MTVTVEPFTNVLDASVTEPLCTVTITLKFVLLTPVLICTEPLFAPLEIDTSLDDKDIFAPVSLLDA